MIKMDLCSSMEKTVAHTKTKTKAFMNRKKRFFLPPGAEVSGNWYPKYTTRVNKDTGVRYGPYLSLLRRRMSDGRKEEVYVGVRGHKLTYTELDNINTMWGGEQLRKPAPGDIRLLLT